MPKGIPDTGNQYPVMLTKPSKRYDAYLVGATMMRTKNTSKNKETGAMEEYESLVLNASMWTPGQWQETDKGLVTIEGAKVPYLFTYNYLNISKRTLRKSANNAGKTFPFLCDLGLSRYVFKDSKDVPSLDPNEFSIEFGTNGLGKNYKGAEFEDLPIFLSKAQGGKDPFVAVAVPLTEFNYKGESLFGLPITLFITVTEDGKYNNVENHFPFEGEAMNLQQLLKAGLPSIPYTTPYRGAVASPVPSTPAQKVEQPGFDYILVKDNKLTREVIKNKLLESAQNAGLHVTQMDKLAESFGKTTTFSAMGAEDLFDCGKQLKALVANGVPDWAEYFAQTINEDSEPPIPDEAPDLW